MPARQGQTPEFPNAAELQEYLDNLTFMSAKVSSDGKILMVNKVALLASGMKEQDLIGCDFLEGQWFSYDKAVSKRAHKAFQAALSGGRRITYDENIFVFGNPLSVNLIFSPIFGKDEKVKYVFVEGFDISERKKSEARWEGIVTNSPSIIQVLDLELNITHISRVVEGINPKDVIGKPFDLWLDKKDAARLRKIFDVVMKSRKSQQYETQGTGPNNTVSWYSCNVGPYIVNGEITGVIMIYSDITTQKKTEEALRKQNEEIESLNKLMVGREVKMVELKRRLAQLEKQVKEHSSS